MKVLIIDKDSMFSALLAGKIRAKGHDVTEKPIKSDGLEELGLSHIDAVYFDCSPMIDPKAMLFEIKRQVLSYTYTVLLSGTIDRMGALKAGCNDGLMKPLDPEWLTFSLDNAQRMVELVARLGNDKIDFPSGGGVIAKSAFNQLFLSALDRASRYDELTHLLFIRIPNYKDLTLDAGRYAADFAISKLAQTLSRLRRQSDILGQTDIHEFALLLQRPMTETEPLDAARRFADTLEHQADLTTNGSGSVAIEISLIHIPTGARDFHYITQITGQGARLSG